MTRNEQAHAHLVTIEGKTDEAILAAEQLGLQVVDVMQLSVIVSGSREQMESLFGCKLMWDDQSLENSGGWAVDRQPLLPQILQGKATSVVFDEGVAYF